MDTSIFGLRFKSNESVQPAPDDIAAFLRSPRAPGAGAQQNDLAAFNDHLARVEAYEQASAQGIDRVQFNEKMLLGVLSHTRFFRPSLRIAVEEYKYHLHRLRQLDFVKPEKFIRSAEEETAKLSPKKKDDQQKIARLQDLVKQRKSDLEALTRLRGALAGELNHIAVYVRDNLAKVQKVCEDAVAGLAGLQVGGRKTEQMIEDIKEYFKNEVRDRRQSGMVTPEYLESVKTEAADLSQRLKKQLLGDVYAVTGVYEAMYEHTKKHASLLTDLSAAAERARKGAAGRDNGAFERTERVLVALVSEFPAEAAVVQPERTEKRLDDLLWEKRREMLGHVFDLLKEQRKGDAWTV